MTGAITAAALVDLRNELIAARARMYVLVMALNQGEIDCASAEVVAGDADDAIGRALDIAEGRDPLS